MGNWIDIFEQYVKSKSAIDCETHYFTFYYKSKENNILNEEEDCIILSSREITQSGSETKISVPIDHEKATEAAIRANAYHVKRQKEDEEEEQELLVRSQQQQI